MILQHHVVQAMCHFDNYSPKIGPAIQEVWYTITREQFKAFIIPEDKPPDAVHRAEVRRTEYRFIVSSTSPTMMTKKQMHAVEN